MNSAVGNSNKSGCGRVCNAIFLVFILLSIIDTMPLMCIAINLEERWRTERVGAVVPDMFPVLVVSHSKQSGKLQAAIVFHDMLKKYLKQHSDYSFIIPPGKAEYVNKQLKRYDYGSGYGVGRITMTQLPNGKQRFKVEGTWDDDRVNIGWYTADSRSFIPIKHVWYFGPGIVLMYVPVIIIFNLVLAPVSYYTCKLIKARFKQCKGEMPNSVS